MNKNSDFEICQIIKKFCPEFYFEVSELPKPFHGEGKIKAIVIGTDPTYKKDNGKFEFVFGLNDENSPFFRGILKNLQEINLSLKNVYVQNLVKNYFREETSKNPIWKKCAILWRNNLKSELDSIFPIGIPVLATAQIILKVLLHEDKVKGLTAGRIYKNKIIFKPEENYLGRPVFAFFRHYRYAMSNQIEYRNTIRKCIQEQDKIT